MFDSVVTPTALYGLSTAPLTARDLEKLASAQRHLLRCMAGFVKVVGEDWSDMYRRLKTRIESALERRPIRLWATELSRRKGELQKRLLRPDRSTLVGVAAAWDPRIVADDKLAEQSKRFRGRPCTAWNRQVP